MERFKVAGGMLWGLLFVACSDSRPTVVDASGIVDASAKPDAPATTDASPGVTTGCVRADGDCRCSVTCGGVAYQQSCSGSTCTCSREGVAFGSFPQAARCFYFGSDRASTLSVMSGCNLPFPCN